MSLKSIMIYSIVQIQAIIYDKNLKTSNITNTGCSNAKTGKMTAKDI